jgi:hypothetical protein
MTSEHKTVIRSDDTSKGFGASKDDIYRHLIRYYTLDGKIILEHDPITKKTTVDEKYL